MTFDDWFPPDDFDTLSRIAALRRRCKVELYFEALPDEKLKAIREACAVAMDDREKKMLYHRKLKDIIKHQKVYDYIETMMADKYD